MSTDRATIRAFHPGIGKPAKNAKPVAAEYGWLSPVRKSVGDPRVWFFRCRCGTQVLKELNNVRAVVNNGNVPKCSKECAHRE